MEFTELLSYKKLKEKDSTLFAQVKNVYELVKDTLNGISRGFDNYTMHDIGHSIRVAHYMEQLAFGIGEDRQKNFEKFNPAELAILLLSALLHDIGMFIRPQDEKEISKGVIRHTEKITYQGVLEVKGGDKKETLKEIIRLTHADRVFDFLDWDFDKGQTIRKLLNIDNKYNFADDIGIICKAHGKNYEFIKSNIRDFVTKGNYTYNLQYFSVLLRIADYLDLDKQRTPILWFSLMGINGFSKSEWETHFQISNETKLKKYYDGKMQIYFDGISANAKIHRKYLKYIDNLRDELEQADILLNNKDTEEKYKLNITTKIDDMVRTEGFEYSDLRLNLDYAAITDLLMGKNIYGNSKLGLRELVQNAIDACKVKNEIEKNDIEINKAYICIIVSKAHNYVKVKDTGIGMTIDIIKNHFLNVGKSYYKSDEYKYNNYKYKPIGQFGIGFLACFLLSDNIVVRTKHYDNNEVYRIELEKNSEYVVTNSEKGSFVGTEIELEYNKFFEHFKGMEELKDFLSRYFYTDIPIFLIDEDERNKEIIKNRSLSDVQMFANKETPQNVELIDCNDYSNVLTGKLLIRKNAKNKVIIFGVDNQIGYIYEKESEKFIKIDKFPNGYYYVINYLIISDEEYQKIKKQKSTPMKKISSLKALSKENKAEIKLFINLNDDFPFPDYFFEDEYDNDNKLKDIFSNSQLPYYPELFYYDSYNTVYLENDECIYLYNVCLFDSDRYHRYVDDDKEMYPTYLYNKDILVKNFRIIRTLCPYSYDFFGCINYNNNDLKLDVARNKILGGEDNLSSEFKKLIMRWLQKNETDKKVRKFLEAIEKTEV